MYPTWDTDTGAVTTRSQSAHWQEARLRSRASQDAHLGTSQVVSLPLKNAHLRPVFMTLVTVFEAVCPIIHPKPLPWTLTDPCNSTYDNSVSHNYVPW